MSGAFVSPEVLVANLNQSEKGEEWSALIARNLIDDTAIQMSPGLFD
jgi:hypothetical protein